MKKDKTNKICITVTQKHIDEGIKNINTGNKCIIALALQDKFPDKTVDVHYDYVIIDGHYYNYSEQMRKNQLSLIQRLHHHPKAIKNSLKPFKFYLSAE